MIVRYHFGGYLTGGYKAFEAKLSYLKTDTGRWSIGALLFVALTQKAYPIITLGPELTE